MTAHRRRVTDQPPEETPADELRTQFIVRFEFVVTLVLDAVVIVVALLARAAVLWVLKRVVPAETHSWAIQLLEFISDIGIVGAATVFTVFDLLKRLIQAYRRLRNGIHGQRRPSRPSTRS